MPAILFSETTPLSLPGAYVPPEPGFHVILFGVIATVTGVGSLIVAWLNWRAANGPTVDSDNIPSTTAEVALERSRSLRSATINDEVEEEASVHRQSRDNPLSRSLVAG